MSVTIGIWKHFTKLVEFRGREDRASFWPYAAVTFIITMVVGMFIFVPMMANSMHAMQQFAAQHPDQATITSGPGQYSISVGGQHPEFFSAGSMALYLAVTFGLAIVLYAAAVTRRLHDRGKSGFWGLMPLPFIIYSSIMMPNVLGSADEPNLMVFFSIFISNMLYIVTLVWLIVWLAGSSQPEPNRYDGES
jgi:uncharacterized membrane protein YhaH (DUF805 family)